MEVLPLRLSASAGNRRSVYHVTQLRGYLVCLLMLIVPLIVLGQTKGRLEIRPRDNPSATFFYAESHALLMGNAHYQDPSWTDLTLIPGELKSLSATLKNSGFQIFQNKVHLDLDEDGMKDLIEAFFETHGLENPDNRLLIFYSGHGETLNGRDGYLVTVDAPDPKKNEVQFRRRVVPVREFRGWALEAQSKHLLFAFDSCFSGTVFSTKSNTAVRRMSQLTGKPVRSFITAGGAGEQVPARGFFTEYFRQGVAGLGDLNADGFVTGTELFLFVREKVADATANTTQNTVRYGPLPDPDFDQGDIVFVVPAAKPAVSTPVPTPVVLPGPKRIVLYGSLVVKSPRAGEVSLDGQGNYGIAAGTGLEWKQLSVGDHRVKVLSGGQEYEETVRVREGQKTEVTAWFGGSQGSGTYRVGEEWSGNGLGMAFMYCPPGTFTMGSPSSEVDRDDDEDQVRVTIGKGFLLGKYEVTQKEWESVMGSNPSDFKGARLPVEAVSWEEVSEFCQKFTEQERRAGRLGSNETYRLPTEAEWEYGCRAGTTSPFSYGSSLSSREANFNGNYPYGGASKGAYLEKTANVGSYKGNAWGLYDMHGNVWEWCQDWYGENLPGGADPSGASTGELRVGRGGSWYLNAQFCRSALRDWFTPSFRSSFLGFRVARVPIH